MFSLSDKFFIAHVLNSNFVFLQAKASSAIASSIIGGQIFIHLCSALLISFEINCFYGL